MGKKAPKLDRGSVLGMPVGPDKWAVAQVLVPGIVFYLGAAPKVFDGLPEAKQIDGLPLSILSWTNDAEVYRGNWKLLGTYEVQRAVNPDIAYKVEVSGQMMVESFDGQSFREYDQETDGHLSYRSSRSPLLVQDMVQAACEMNSEN
jgi:hypothetical protein